MTESSNEVYARITNLSALAIFALTFVASFVIEHFFLPGRGKIVFLGLFVTIAIVWPFRRHAADHGVMTLLATMLISHIVLMAFLPLRDQAYPGAILIPVGLVDYSIFFVLISRAIKSRTR